jgi:hypothetical protein
VAFGQSFAVYKIVQTATKAVCHISGASEKDAEGVSTYAGAYVAYFAAFITADPVGAAGVAADVINKNKEEKWIK